MIAGTFSLLSLPLYALVDSGSTHSYVLREHACYLGLCADELDVGVHVTSSFGDVIVTRKVYRRCPLEVQGWIFLVDLMELPFFGFDIILGMDWLSTHHAIVDCEMKRVRLRLADGYEVVIVGENNRFLSNLVSAMEAN